MNEEVLEKFLDGEGVKKKFLKYISVRGLGDLKIDKDVITRTFHWWGGDIDEGGKFWAKIDLRWRLHLMENKK